MAQPSFEAGSHLVRLVVKNPNPSQAQAKQDFAVSVPSHSTIGQVKNLLQQRYAGNPAPAAQTLIYAGKVLKNDDHRLSDLLDKLADPELPHSLHLVVKSSAAASSSNGNRPSPAVANGLPSTSSNAAQAGAHPASRTSQGARSAGPSANGTPADPPPSTQAGAEQAFGNPYAHSSPALAAAYNAAFAALSAQGPISFPDLSQLPPGSVPSALGGQLSAPIPFNLTPHLLQQQQQQSHPQQQQFQQALFQHNNGQGQASGFLSAQIPTFSFPMPAMPHAGVGVPHMRPAPAPAPAVQRTGEAATPAPGSSDGVSSGPTSSAPSPGASTGSPAAPAASAAQSQPFYAPPAFAYVPVSLMPSMPVASTSQPQGSSSQPAQLPADTSTTANGNAINPQHQQQQQQAQQMPMHALPFPVHPLLPVAVPYGVYHPLMPPAVLPPQAAGQQQGQAIQFPAASAAHFAPAQQFAVLQQQQFLPGHQAVAFQAQMQPAAGGNVNIMVNPQQQHHQHRGAHHPQQQHRQGQAQIRVQFVRINLRVALQLLVLAGILYQHCPPGRFMLIMGGVTLMYLAGFAPFRVAMQRAMGIDPRRAGNLRGGRARGAGNAGAGGGDVAAAAPVGVLQEIQSLLVGFFTSLLPGWNVNPEDAAAFAAAQQAAAAEAVREARAMQNAGRPHQD